MNKTKTKGTPDNIDVHVGNRLKVRRSLLGLSQEKLAEAVGLTFQQIQKYERGVNRISAGRLFQLSKILDVPVGFFYEKIGGETVSAYHGMSDNSQEPFGLEDDVLHKKETLELVRVYYSIEDPAKRKEIIRFIKMMGANNAE